MKPCSKCGGKKSEGRKHSWCKKCCAAGMRQWRADHPEEMDRVRSQIETWKQGNREHALQLVRDWRSRNKERVSALNKKWRAANPARSKELSEASNRTRRAKLAMAPGDGVTADQWKEVVAEFGGRCAYCNCVVNRPWMDHMDPIAIGGAHDISNVVPSCGPCNMSKGALTALEFLTGLRLDRKVG